jgi:putative selenate reductase molybdopterin-binding subunit
VQWLENYYKEENLPPLLSIIERETKDSMEIQLLINGISHELEIASADTLFHTLRRLGFHGVKFGDENGLTGADTILLDGRPVNAGLILTAQTAGHKIVTIEALGEHPDQGWTHTVGLHPLQQAFIETGAIQCGYCTPAQLLAAKALLDKNPNPTEAEVRAAIAGVLCRCTGYEKPVQAILHAVEMMQREVQPSHGPEMWSIVPGSGNEAPAQDEHGVLTPTRLANKIIVTPETKPYQVVGKPEPKVDAIKLAQGKPAFTADFEMRGLDRTSVV